MCKHEQFIKSLGKPQSNREYWIMTEIFVYLHNGKDYCDCQETAHNSDYTKCPNCGSDEDTPENYKCEYCKTPRTRHFG